MSFLQTIAAIACLLLLAAIAGASDGRRGQLGVGLVILPACPLAAVPAEPDPPAEGARSPDVRGPPGNMEEYRHCAGGPARVTRQEGDNPDPTRPPATRGSRSLLVEF